MYVILCVNLGHARGDQDLPMSLPRIGSNTVHPHADRDGDRALDIEREEEMVGNRIVEIDGD